MTDTNDLVKLVRDGLKVPGPRYSLNIGRPLPTCPSPKPRVTVISYHDDGDHHWGRPVTLGNCYYEYTCTECGVRMTVDSSD